MGRSVETTAGIEVEAVSRYVEERSNPGGNHYFFAYRIRLHNRGSVPARLVSRHWVITDGNGNDEHVRGPGVVGETPRLMPGQSFEYESFCPLPTPLGAMRGTYQMVRDDGEPFEIVIGEFSLELPYSIN